MDGTWTGRLESGSCGRAAAGALARLRRLPTMGVALFDQALISGASFLVVIAVARGAETEEFGLFTLAFSVLLFALSLVYALVNLPLSVLLPECDAAEVNAYLVRLERVHRALVPILFLIALPFLGLFASWPLVIATALGTATRMAAEYHRRIAYGFQDSARALAIDVAAHGLLAAAALIALVAHLRFHAWHAMAVVAVTGLLGWVTGLYANRRLMRAPEAEAMIDVARRHWSFGKWNLGGTLAMWSASQLYPFLIAGMLGLADVALINGSLRVMGVINVLVQGLDSFATPRLRALAVAGDLAAYRRMLNKVFTIGSAMLVPVLAAVIIAPERVLSVTLGPGYAHGGFALRMIAIATTFTFVARVAGMGLNGLKEARPGFWGQVACAIVTLAAGPWIIRHYRLSGACVALAANAALTAAIVGSAFQRIFAALGREVRP